MTDTTTETVETPVDDVQAPETEPETFPREYVEKLRQEAAEARVKGKRADDYARELFHARVAATGRLADPSDLPFDEALLTDQPTLVAAIDALISEHPHYAARTPRGDIGQGANLSVAPGSVNLADMLRARA